MKDRVIGSVFNHPTEGKLGVVAEPAAGECYGCVFNGTKGCLNDPDKYHTGRCASRERSDNTGVIFIHVEGGDNV